MEITLQQTAYTTSENNGTITVCAQISSGNLETEVGINLTTVDDTATSAGYQIYIYYFTRIRYITNNYFSDPADFLATDVQLSFSEGSSVGNLTCTDIQILNDTILESVETFEVLLKAVDANVTMLPAIASKATVVILDSDGKSVGT